MKESPKNMQRCNEDQQPRSVEDLSQYSLVSPAFIRLCIENGCPAPDNQLSQTVMIEWLALNYVKVRAAAGLPALAPIDGVRASARRKLQLADTMLTLLDYAESRCTRLDEKIRLRGVRSFAERAL